MMRFASVLLSAVFLYGCGGGGSSGSSTIAEQPAPPPTPTIYTGSFVDSAVQGLAFETATESGLTNEAGEFTYQQGEVITFSIGSINFPQVAAAELMTPLELFLVKNIDDIRVINAIRLLQSLDADGEPLNGIEIAEQVHDLTTDIFFDFSSDDFEQKANDYIATLGIVHTKLVSADQARFHFNQTLANIGYNLENECAADHPKVGYSGTFQTRAHNVAGTATFIDNCTIEITNFTYDGQGPEVFFYASSSQEFVGDGSFALGDRLDGTVFDNANLLIKLPEGKTLDNINSLSVWCVEFSADFGSLTFTP
ncbi:DM13 domain-containing protein [Thalassotalea atypica]|uniref:DM13 domain-containing protein n=1 Tax=Thalassotalea atypica TaxID=2054316 RepID=UPI002573B428|nr:DM13 domain-containing protein [Thalassotalea atypica]